MPPVTVVLAEDSGLLRDGRLVASTAQEGMLRARNPNPRTA